MTITRNAAGASGGASPSPAPALPLQPVHPVTSPGGGLWDVGGLPGPPGTRVRQGRLLIADDRRAVPSPAGRCGAVPLVLELDDHAMSSVGRGPGRATTSGDDLSADGAAAGGLLRSFGPGIAATLSHLACPGCQPAVLCCPPGDAWIAPFTVVLWELLGVPRSAMAARVARAGGSRADRHRSRPRRALEVVRDANRCWADHFDRSVVRAVTSQIDRAGGLARWWSTTDGPTWAPESLRATLLERALPGRPL